MKTIFSALLLVVLCCTYLFHSSAEEVDLLNLFHDEDMMVEAYATNGSETINFHYPIDCELAFFDHSGTIVSIDPDSSVAVILIEQGVRAADRIAAAKDPADELVYLTEKMCILTYQAYRPTGLPFIQPQDIVQVGVDLDNGMSVIVQSSCITGKEEVYGLLMQILASISDATPLEEWLTNTWLPKISPIAMEK